MIINDFSEFSRVIQRIMDARNSKRMFKRPRAYVGRNASAVIGSPRPNRDCTSSELGLPGPSRHASPLGGLGCGLAYLGYAFRRKLRVPAEEA
jgi:hypothetical protein